MAERRMFAKSIVDSDAFLELPCTAQTLYFHLCIKADDDGFSNTPKKTKRILGASDSDLALLENGGFIISFDSGVVVIRHWKVHNYVRKDTYRKTIHSKELSELYVTSDGLYEKITENNDRPTVCDDLRDENRGLRQRPVDEPSTSRQRSVDESSTQYSIVKDREVKDSLVEYSKVNEKTPVSNICAPSFEAVKEYCRERGNKIDAEKFYNFYADRNWIVNGIPMNNWRACVRNWEKMEYKRPPPHTKAESRDRSFEVGEFFDAAVNRSYRNLNVRT